MSVYFYTSLVISSYLIPIAAGLHLILQRRSTIHTHFLLYYLVLTIFVEIMGIFLAMYSMNNLWLYRLYIYVELIFPTIFFFTQISKKLLKLLTLVLFASSLAITATLDYYQDWDDHATVQTVVSFSYIGFIIISYFIEMFQSEKVVNPFKDIHFIVGSLLLIAQSLTFIYNILYNHMLEGLIGDEIEVIFNTINLFLIVFNNFIFAYALWMNKRTRT